jgi:hypothetical protein
MAKAAQAESPEQLKARIAELEGKLDKQQQITFQVGVKGGVSVYGLGRFPVTLYYEQWKRLATAIPQLLAFMEANKSRLKLKE